MNSVSAELSKNTFYQRITNELELAVTTSSKITWRVSHLLISLTGTNFHKFSVCMCKRERERESLPERYGERESLPERDGERERAKLE